MDQRLAYRLLYSDMTGIGVSQGVSDSMRACGVTNVHTVLNAIDFSRLDHAAETAAIRKQPGVTDMMIFGNHYVRKGVDIAAEAVKRLNAEGYPVHLYIASFPRFFDEIREYAVAHTDASTFDRYITCIPAVEDIADYYAKTDIFLSPSREEGFTYAITEAAYCGCSVIASAISGQKENALPPPHRWIGDPAMAGDIAGELANV